MEETEGRERRRTTTTNRLLLNTKVILVTYASVNAIICEVAKALEIKFCPCSENKNSHGSFSF